MTPKMFKLSIVLYVGMSVIALLLLHLDVRPFGFVSFFSVTTKSFLTSVSIAIFVITASTLSVYHLPVMTDLITFFYAIFKETTIIQCLILAALSSVGEELLFRGVLPHYIGVHGATIVFAVLHTGPGVKFLMWTFFALLVGYALSWMVVSFDSLTPAIITHFLINGVNLVVIKRMHRAI